MAVQRDRFASLTPYELSGLEAEPAVKRAARESLQAAGAAVSLVGFPAADGREIIKAAAGLAKPTKQEDLEIALARYFADPSAR